LVKTGSKRPKSYCPRLKTNIKRDALAKRWNKFSWFGKTKTSFE